jgi:hypothetical protein
MPLEKTCLFGWIFFALKGFKTLAADLKKLKIEVAKEEMRVHNRVGNEPFVWGALVKWVGADVIADVEFIAILLVLSQFFCADSEE